MLVSTDDAARRLSFVWKGPPESPMPFEARYQAWIGALALTPVLSTGAYLLLLLPLDLAPWHTVVRILVHLVAAFLVGAGAAIWAVRKFGQVVTPVRPLTHHASVLLAEARAPRPPKVERLEVAAPADLFTPTGDRGTLLVASAAFQPVPSSTPDRTRRTS